jgi:antitoxin MazE
MATIQKWGNSLAVRIPRALAEQLQVSEGTPVRVRVAEGMLVVEPEGRPKYRLSDLLADCKPRQLHGELDWGPDVGREVVE